jgi:hypothetical protein
MTITKTPTAVDMDFAVFTSGRALALLRQGQREKAARAFEGLAIILRDEELPDPLHSGLSVIKERETATRLLKWCIHQMEGESGGSVSYWVKFREYRQARFYLATQARRSAMTPSDPLAVYNDAHRDALLVRDEARRSAADALAQAIALGTDASALIPSFMAAHDAADRAFNAAREQARLDYEQCVLRPAS